MRFKTILLSLSMIAFQAQAAPLLGGAQSGYESSLAITSAKAANKSATLGEARWIKLFAGNYGIGAYFNSILGAIEAPERDFGSGNLTAFHGGISGQYKWIEYSSLALISGMSMGMGNVEYARKNQRKFRSNQISVARLESRVSLSLFDTTRIAFITQYQYAQLTKHPVFGGRDFSGLGYGVGLTVKI